MTKLTTALRSTLATVAGLKRRTVFGFALLLPIAASADVSTISIGDAAVTQPASGGTPMVFTLTRTGDTGYAVVVPYASVDNTAVAGTDYSPFIGNVTIPAGASAATVSVPVLGGSNTSDKSFFLDLASATGVGPAPSFAARQRFATNGAPSLIRVADINGDGRPDLLTRIQELDSVSVLLSTTSPGAPSVSFGAEQIFAVGGKPLSISTGDVNRDGRPDLLVANLGNTGSVSVLINSTPAGSGAASFASPQSFATGSGDIAIFVGAADVNNDGCPDLLVTTGRSTSVLLNTSTPGTATPTFAAPQRFTVVGEARYVTTADINGDGRPDLLVASRSINGAFVSVLLNTAAPGAVTPSFSAGQSYSSGVFVEFIDVDDVNGDGRPDLLATSRVNFTSEQYAAFILINATAPGADTPSFASGILLTDGPTGIFAAADLNGDGRPDLSLANTQTQGITALVNTSAAAPAPVPFTSYRTPFSFAIRQDIASGEGAPFEIVSADLNGDGRPDLVTVNAGSNAVSVLLNTTPASAATPGFSAQQGFGTGRTPESVCSADLNGDGRPDLATADYNSGSVSALLNTSAPGAGAAAFAAKQSFNSGGDLPNSVACADMNGDGRPDVLVANNLSRNVALLLNTTAPGATVPTLGTAQPFATDFLPLSVDAVDLNGDGRPDLLATNFIANAGTVNVWINTTPPGAPGASFAERQSFNTGFGAPHNLAGADVNGDGRPDLLVAQQGVGLVTLLNTTAAGATAASFADFRTFATGSGVTFDVSTADINGDGRPDALLANEDTDTVSVLLNGTAPGATAADFSRGENFVTGDRPQSVRAADFDGDSRPDLVVVNENANTVAVLLNRTASGATTPSFEAPRLLATGSLPSAVTAADFNGDGQPDLAVSNFSSDNVSVLLNTLYGARLGDGRAVGTIRSRGDIDTTPDPFSFTPASGVAPGSVNTSNTITVSGINGPTPIGIAGGSYRIGSGSLVTGNGLVNNGDRVTVRTTASSQLNTTVTATLTIGGVRADYRVTTVNDDCTPDPFRFTRVKPAALNTVYVSNTVVITGIPTTVECRARTSTGGMSVNGGPFTTERVQLFNGDTVRLRITSSSTANRTVHATFRMGEAIRSFDVTTGN